MQRIQHKLWPLWSVEELVRRLVPRPRSRHGATVALVFVPAVPLEAVVGGALDPQKHAALGAATRLARGVDWALLAGPS